jgi:catechol-2,3-dioxygenase
MRIETLELLTGDLDAQRTFYGDQLGFPVRSEGELRVTVGSSDLVFRHEPGFRGIYHFALDVPYGQVGAAEEFLKERGLAPLTDSSGKNRIQFESWCAESVYFRDAADNTVEFIGRREIEVNSREMQILHVSEIGVACADVLATAENLGSALGVSGYRQTSSDFFPLGDAKGLLILAQTGRLWYPDTGVPAQELPFKAVVRTETGRWSVSAGSDEARPIELRRLD